MMLERERDNKLMNLEAVTAAIAHEVNQPLAAIVTNGSVALHFLERAPPDLDEVSTVLNEIISDGHRTSEVFDSIRALFRKGDSGKQSLNVNDIIVGVLNSLREELRNRGVEARTELASTLPRVAGHRGQLQEVISNLIGNALDAMNTTTNRSRLLLVRTEARGSDAIVVSVQDSGPGIAPKHLDSIFTAFVTTKPQGIGMGLAICRMIIERHGGRLTASSDGTNGALFQFELPIEPTITGAAREEVITS
jgi:C4-dicarboxylate-specific signal transduction histidine kinase